MSGTRDGQDWPPPGAVLDLPETEARQLVAHRNATVIEEKDDPEDGPDGTDPEDGPDDADPEATEDGTGARRRGRPRLPRDAEGNIVRT
ncbi:hypothetical protein AMK13_10535 [Streptomyces sp. CB02056]|nr:hypothetical protein AMK13_10535 [Streptomyces sp. CB02056]